MKIASVKEFRDKATEMMRSDEPVIITRNGKAAGLYIPLTNPSEVPLELRKSLFRELAEQMKRQREQHGITEEEILEDFEAYRKTRR